MKTRVTTGLKMAALGAVAALTLAACGGNSEAPSGKADSASATDITVLRTNGGQFEGILLGKEQGIWEKHGLNITDEIGADSSAQRVPPLLNGEAEFAQIDATAVIRAVSEGLPIKIVGAVQNAPSRASEGYVPADGVVVPPDSSITSIKDLSGKTVGVPALGATVHVIALVALEDAGVDPATVEFVALPAANLISSTKEGQVDAVALWGTFYAQAISDGFTAVGPSVGEAIEGLPQIVWGASEQYVTSNEGTVSEFLAANKEAQEYANEHPDDRRRLMAEVTELPQSYIDSAWLIPFANVMHRDAVNEMAQALERYGFIDEAPTADEIIWAKAEQQ